MAVLIDSYNESNRNTRFGTSTNMGIGQSFTNTSALKLSSALLMCSKFGSPTGTAVARLRTHAGTYGSSSYPTGAVLATSDSITIESLSTTTLLKTFTFTGANIVTLAPNTYYCIEVYYTFTFGDANNQAYVGWDDTSPTHSGNSYYNTSAQSGVDAPFYVYGEPITLKKYMGIASASIKKAQGVAKASAKKINKISL